MGLTANIDRMASNALAIARPSPSSPRSRPHGPRPSALPTVQRRQHVRSPSAPSAPSTTAAASVARAQSLAARTPQPPVARSGRRSRPLSAIPDAKAEPGGSPSPPPSRSSSSGALSGLRSLIRSGSRSRKLGSAAPKPSPDANRNHTDAGASEPPKRMWKRVRTLSQSSNKSAKARHAASSSASLPISEKADASQLQPQPQPQSEPQPTPSPQPKPEPAPAPQIKPGESGPPGTAAVLTSRLPAPRTAGSARPPGLAQAGKPAPAVAKSPSTSDGNTRKPAPALDRQNMIRFPIATASRPLSGTPPAAATPLQPAARASSPPPPTTPSVPPPSQLNPVPSLAPAHDEAPAHQSQNPTLLAGLQPGQYVPNMTGIPGTGASSSSPTPEQPADGNTVTDTCEGYAISPNVVEDQAPNNSMRQRSLVGSTSSTPRMSVRSLPAPPRTIPVGLTGSATSDSTSTNYSPKSRSSLEPVAEGKRSDARSNLAPPHHSEEGHQTVSPTPPPPYSLRTASAASGRTREHRFEPSAAAEPHTPTTPTVLVHPPMPSGSGSRSGSRMTMTSFRTAQTAPSPILLSPPATGGPALHPIEPGSSGTGTAVDAVSVTGSENTIQPREEDISVAEIETNLSIVEAALAEHDAEGSFDVGLLRPLSAPMQEFSSGSHTSAHTSNMALSPFSDERRRTLNPGSNRALTQAVRAVRQALGPSSSPQPGSNVRRDVEEAYARMLALVAQNTDDPTPPVTPLAQSPAPAVDGQGQAGDKTNGSGADRTDPMVAAPTLPRAASSERFFASGGGAQDRTRAVAAWATYSAHPDGDEDDPPRRRFMSDPRRRALPELQPNIDAEKLAGRYRLEKESLLDALERAEAKASEARQERSTLQTDLRREVARVLQLERALSQAQSRAEKAETKLERVHDQLRVEQEARFGLMHQLEQLTAAWPRSGSDSANLTAMPAPADKNLGDAGRRSNEGNLPTSLSIDTATARFLSPVEDEQESRSPSPLLETQMPDVPTIDDADLLPVPSSSSPPAVGRSTRRKPPAVESRIPSAGHGHGLGHLRTSSTSGTSLRKASNSTGESSFTARTPSSSVGAYVYDRLGRGYYDPHRPLGYSQLEVPGSRHREIFDSSIDEAF